jgi:hypothetical protein
LSLGDANATEYLGGKAPIRKPAEIVVTYGKYVEKWISVTRNNQEINQQMATLVVGGTTALVAMNSVWSQSFMPLPAGVYTVPVPDAPHDKDYTRLYRGAEPSLKYDQVWFPIQFGDNSRFVHVGNLSDGCTTVLDLAKWADVHEELISHRSADGLSVATLTINGTPERAK